MKTLEDIKREVFRHLDDLYVNQISIAAGDAVDKAIDHLHAQGLLMVWNTDMDAAPRDGRFIIGLHEGKIHRICSWSRSRDRWVILGAAKVGFFNPTAWMPLPPIERSHR